MTPYTDQGLSRGATVLAFLLGIFMGALDHGIVGPALSSILEQYGLETRWGVWSFTIYTLLFAVSIPVLGKLSDRFGRKRTFGFGIAMFALGSLLAALAPNFILFLLGRAVQAVGTGGIFPIAAAQIAVSSPPERRGRMLGLIGMVFGLGTIAGPVLGAVIMDAFAWQWIFLINVPVSAVILVMIAGIKQAQPKVERPIDFPGIAVLTSSILALMLGITLKQAWLIGFGILLIPLLAVIERRSQDPIVNVRYFTRPYVLILFASSTVSGFVMASATHLIPYFAETVLAMDRASAGLSVTPLAAASAAASFAGGYLVDKAGARRALLIGFAVSFAGAALLAGGIDTAAAFYPVIAAMGFGIGIIIGAPLNVLIMQVVEPADTGAAVGYISLFRSLGSTMGPTVAGLFLAVYDNGFIPLFAVSAGASGISMLLLLFCRKRAASAVPA